MLRAALLLSTLISATSLASPDYVWIEAEKPDRTNFPKANPFAPANDDERGKLSGSAWIGVAAARKVPLFLEYRIDVPADGEWTLYARKFWKHGPYRFRFDEGAWTDVGRDAALLDDVQLRTNVVANWTLGGKTTLSKGKHTLQVQLTQLDGAAAFDCFILTTQPFTPRGKMKPDEKLDAVEAGWTAFQPDADVADSPIDLRFLNEPVAGSKGPIGMRDGRFIHSQTGEAVRFWGVNAPSNVFTLSDDQLDRLAQSLAMRGVNLVRLHGKAFEDNGPDFGKPDAKHIERMQAAVAAFKRHGIYSTLSIYFPLWIKLDAARGFPGYKNASPFGLLFWDEKFQQMHREWFRALLTGDNKYGPKLADDPAILSLEILNEDSLFFWTFDPHKRIPAEAMASLEKRFGDWLAKKYGSIDDAMKTWAVDALPGDAPAEGRVGLPNAWRMFNVRDQRSKDSVTFLAEVQRDFYSSTRAFLKDELKSVSLVSGTNWTTASSQYLTPIERWTNLSADFIDRHGYFQGVTEGEGAGYSIRVGQKYSDRSMLRLDPADPRPSKDGKPPRREFFNPVPDMQFDDRPTMLSEVEWPEPNRFRGEAPAFAAAYASLNDLDAIIFFALTGSTWSQTLANFAVQTPTGIGQYPAAALIYRQGLVDEAPVVADVTLNVTDLVNLKGWPIGVGVDLDAIRKADRPPGELVPSSSGVDARTNYVGRIRVSFVNDGPSETKLAKITDFIADDRITSITKQIEWNPQMGVLTLNAPRAQGATGFLAKRGSVELNDVTIDVNSEFASVLVVPLDGQPIATSKKLLLQVATEQKPFGWQTEGDAVKTITNIGGPPLMLRDIDGAVSLKRADAKQLRVTPIAANGARMSEATTDASTIQLKPGVLYYLIER
jgi:hypothetical protein